MKKKSPNKTKLCLFYCTLYVFIILLFSSSNGTSSALSFYCYATIKAFLGTLSVPQLFFPFKGLFLQAMHRSLFLYLTLHLLSLRRSPLLCVCVSLSLSLSPHPSPRFSCVPLTQNQITQLSLFYLVCTYRQGGWYFKLFLCF